MVQKKLLWYYKDGGKPETANGDNTMRLQKMWALGKPILDAHISSLEVKIKRLEQKIDEIVMERISGEHAGRFPPEIRGSKE